MDYPSIDQLEEIYDPTTDGRWQPIQVQGQWEVHARNTDQGGDPVHTVVATGLTQGDAEFICAMHGDMFWLIVGWLAYVEKQVDAICLDALAELGGATEAEQSIMRRLRRMQKGKLPK